MENQEEHGQSLEKLLNRERGNMFNKEKSEFSKDSSVYYVMVFSKEETSPYPRKVDAI